MVGIIQATQAEDEDEYRHIYLGEPREDDDAVIIKRSWIMAAIDAHKKLGIHPSGAKRVGFDVADSGADKCAAVATHGFLTVQVEEWKASEDELLKSAGRVYAMAQHYEASIDYDSIGIGAFSGAHFQDLNKKTGARIAYFRFNAGGEVIHPDRKVDPKDPRSSPNRDYYANLKAQTWWGVAKRFRNTFNAVTNGERFAVEDLISIASDCDHLDELVDELSTPRRDFDNNGKVKVESKKDLANAKRPGGPVPSPNLADAFVMAYAPRVAGALYIPDDVLAHSRRR